MSTFFWGMFCGGFFAIAIGMGVGLAADDDSPKSQAATALSAAWLVVGMCFVLAIGIWLYQGSGVIQVIPPTPTPLLGR
jgi:hypothetical protein